MLYLLLGVAAVAVKPAMVLANTTVLPPEVISAKSIYIDNQTGSANVYETAKKKFSEWGRFSLSNSEHDADLKVVFTHKFGIDYLGNTSFIVMDVYLKGSNSPVFQSKNAFKLLVAPQLRTEICISHFRKRLEQKN